MFCLRIKFSPKSSLTWENNKPFLKREVFTEWQMSYYLLINLLLLISITLLTDIMGFIWLDGNKKLPEIFVERNTRDLFESNILVFAYVYIRIPQKPLLFVDFAPAGFRAGNLHNIGL
jgi:uncharacterized BrkB/YihY/UPF0761 family membrane protein